ncbi:MAG: hypothetical protein ACI4IK_02940 [Eubacterium sp.]
MIHTDYIFYKDIFKGNIIPDETAFNSSVNEAIAYINRLTRGKANNLASIPTNVDMAVCAVAEIVYKENTSSNITSESVGNHSVSYSATSSDERERKKCRKATIYLSGTGLLYGGMC